MPELNQPLMVVVDLLALARATTGAEAAEAVVETNEWTANLSHNSSAMALAAAQHNGSLARLACTSAPFAAKAQCIFAAPQHACSIVNKLLCLRL